MCLGIPGQIVEISSVERTLVIADVLGVRREINVACILDDEPLENLIGVWTLIHVGFAMSRIDEDDAAKTLESLRKLGEAQHELDAMHASHAALEPRP